MLFGRLCLCLFSAMMNDPNEQEAADESVKNDQLQKRIVDLTQTLVQIPSQGGIDSALPICEALIDPLRKAGLDPQFLFSNDDDDEAEEDVVGVIAEIQGQSPGPTYILDAVIDTAPVGNVDSWSSSSSHPLSGRIVMDTNNNKKLLYGRGSADSKVAAAIFVEVGRRLQHQKHLMKGTTILFFDAAEHTGKFEGIQALIKRYPPHRIDGVLIGYPGNDTLYIGSRGFERSTLTLSFHTTSSSHESSALNNHSRMEDTIIQLISRIADFSHNNNNNKDIDAEEASPFGSLPPKRTITALKTISYTPTLCLGALDADVTTQIFELQIGGTSCHSGSSRSHGGINAVLKSKEVLKQLLALTTEKQPSSNIRNVRILDWNTKRHHGFSMVPDVVELIIGVSSISPPSSSALLDKDRTMMVQQKIERILKDVQERYPSRVDSRISSSKILPLSSSSSSELQLVSSLSVNIDTRTTPSFGMEESRDDLKNIVHDCTSSYRTSTKDDDHGHSQLITTNIESLESWPAFALDPNHPLRRAMERAVSLEHLPSNNRNPNSNADKMGIPSKVSGPSNVGNLLARYAVPATTGYGVGFVGMHAADEHIDLTTIPTTFNVYMRAIRDLMMIEKSAEES